MLLANQSTDRLAPGDIVDQARRRQSKASVVPKQKLFELQRGGPKQPVSIFTHRHTSDTVRAR